MPQPPPIPGMNTPGCRVAAGLLLVLALSCRLPAAERVVAAELDPDPRLSPAVAPDASGVPTVADGTGEAAFYLYCTTCHDEQRARGKRKDFSGWYSTVQRMAAKDGAAVPAGSWAPIARYLAGTTGSDGASDTAGLDAALTEVRESTTSVFATLSPVWRGANDRTPLENPGFFPDLWAGIQWRPNEVLSAQLTACTSCHSDNNPSRGFSLELVEASASVDLLAAWACSRGLDPPADSPLELKLKGGRLVVPFGAAAALSNPGMLRTLSLPLAFNMGRRAGLPAGLQPVLPAPYADEGINLQAALTAAELPVTLDLYAVNGLQGADPGLFNASRSYMDNNHEPAAGARVTAGSRQVRVGGSWMSGNLADAGQPDVAYKLVGGDVTARWEDWLRLYFEYALRRDASIFVANEQNLVYGSVVEGELLLSRIWPLQLLLRYDTLEHRHSAFGDSTIDRFTYGLNFTGARGDLLMVQHEHWMLNDGTDTDVLGVRWTTTW